MTTTHQGLDEDLVSRFPGGIEVGTSAFNKIAAMNAMIDFIAKGDPSCVERYFTSPYYNHNMRAPDGLAPVRDLAERGLGWAGQHTIIRRVLAEGNLVLLHSLYSNLLGIAGQRVALDLFRFDAGKIVEHWDALEHAVAPDLSGLSQIEGSVDISDLGQEAANRSLVEAFVDAVLVANRSELAGRFIDEESYVAHSPRREPGLARSHGTFVGVAGAMTAVYLKSHISLAEGNFVFVQGEGRIGDAQVLEVYDLFRLQAGKIVEHWDVLQPLAPQSEWANDNGPFGYTRRGPATTDQTAPTFEVS